MSAPDAAIFIWRDTDDPSVLWRFLTKDGGVGAMADSYELEVCWPSQSEPMDYSTIADSAVLVMNRDAGELRWLYSQADSHRLPRAERTTYQIFGTTSGRRRLWIGGTVNVGTYQP